VLTNIDVTLKNIMSIEGAIAAALVDYTSGMTLGVLGGGPDLDITVAAAGNTDVVRAKLRTIQLLGLGEGIEDMLITLDTQYHIIRPLRGANGQGLFLYLALSKSRSNLALARHHLRLAEEKLEL
jgi:hypothetical protein